MSRAPKEEPYVDLDAGQQRLRDNLLNAGAVILAGMIARHGVPDEETEIDAMVQIAMNVTNRLELAASNLASESDAMDYVLPGEAR